MSLKSTIVRTLIVPGIRIGLRLLEWVSPNLAARVLANRFLATRRRTVPEREVAWLQGSRSFEVEVDGVSLHVVSWGERTAPAVLLMHGWEGRASQLGAFAAPLVAAGFRALAIDAPGHGRSPGRRSSILEMGNAIQAVAESVGGLHAIVAHSGGSVAASFAVDRGIPVERLVFLSAPFDAGRFLYEAASQWGLSRSVALRSQRLLENRLGVRWEEFELERLARRRSEPLLVVHDQRDRIIEVEEGKAIALVWPGARLIETEGLGHHRILRDEKVVTLVTDFVVGGRVPAMAS